MRLRRCGTRRENHSGWFKHDLQKQSVDGGQLAALDDNSPFDPQVHSLSSIIIRKKENIFPRKADCRRLASLEWLSARIVESIDGDDFLLRSHLDANDWTEEIHLLGDTFEATISQPDAADGDEFRPHVQHA
nr:hypothetical protein [Microvirga vignae]